jgi:hypothetical protein
MTLPANWVRLVRDFDGLNLVDFELDVGEVLKLTPNRCQGFLVAFEGIGLEIGCMRGDSFLELSYN